jgi:hypothetical protein
LTVLIEAHYLPSIAYFAALVGAESILLERHEHFVKQTYRNRCRIITANGELDLIVPITAKHGKVRITDVRVDFTQKWLNNHWRTVQSAYGNAPFFEYYADDLRDTLYKKVGFLYDLNRALLSMCLNWLKWDMPIKETEYYTQSVSNPLLDLRSAVNPKKMDQCYEFYYPVMYNQVFGSTFVENLSLIDLIFCVGPGAGKIVRDSAIPKMNK